MWAPFYAVHFTNHSIFGGTAQSTQNTASILVECELGWGHLIFPQFFTIRMGDYRPFNLNEALDLNKAVTGHFTHIYAISTVVAYNNTSYVFVALYLGHINSKLDQPNAFCDQLAAIYLVR
jgi:hypothetical protein